MTTKVKVPKIKPLEGYKGMSDTDIVARATAALTGLTGNSNFPNPPVDLAALKTAIDTFSALIAEALDGSKRVIAQKNKQRQAVITMLRLLGRYVEVTSNGDMAVFQTSGFQAAATTRASSEPLSESIRKITHGDNSGQINVSVRPIRGAQSYEIRYGAAGPGGATPTMWTNHGVPGVKTPFVVTGLTPAMIYVFQARALLKTGYTDWSDSVTFICT